MWWGVSPTPTASASSGADYEHNPDRGVSVADLGLMVSDPRAPYSFDPGGASSKAFFGWLQNGAESQRAFDRRRE